MGWSSSSDPIDRQEVVYAGERAVEEMPVREALERLSPADREVLLLAEWEGLSAAEIAAVLGCLTVTARGRLHRARRRFRAAFDEAVGAEAPGAVQPAALVFPRGGS